MKASSLHPFVAGAQKLSPAPIIMAKLLDLFSHDEKDIAQITQTIKNDPFLTANLLMLCNSAMIRGSHRVDNIEEAVIRLGICQIQRKVMILYAGKLLRSPKIASYKENQLWEHSLATAIAAKQIASTLGLEENQAFTLGLLHDLGKVVIVLAVPQYEQIFLRAATDQIPLFTAENNQLGIDHGELGYQLLNEWKVPADISANTKELHHPVSPTAAVVFLGDYVAYQINKGFGPYLLNKEDFLWTTQTLGLAAEAIQMIGQNTLDELEREKASLQTKFTNGL
jgi:putative nucleotidyltransferase with HDIG domain